MGRTEHHEDCGRPNLFLSFTKYKYHNTNTNKNLKKETNLEGSKLAENK